MSTSGHALRLIPGVLADHTALYFEHERILCFADLHLGYDEELFAKGVHIPTQEWKQQRALIGSLVAKYRPETVVLNGDVKHNFGSINNAEWRHTLELLDMIAAHATLVIVAGNHDAVLAPIAAKRGFTLADYYRVGSLLFVHGDVAPTAAMRKGCSVLVIGHEHPAIRIGNGVREEQYKCFVTIPGKPALIVQPSTFSLTTGTDVRAAPLRGPVFTSLRGARIAVVGEDGAVLDFGALTALGEA